MPKVGGPKTLESKAPRHFLTEENGEGNADGAAPRIRIDKWLWQARFFKSRTIASAVVQSGHLRINGQPISRASREVSAGDVLTFPQGNHIRLIRILGTGIRRGPASEAQLLFIDLDRANSVADSLE